MEVDGMMVEAGAEVAPEAGAHEAGAEVVPEAGASEAAADASEPPSEPLADEQYEAGADVMDDVDEVKEVKVLSKRDYGDNSPSQKRPFVAKGVWVWIRRLKKHPPLIATNPTQLRTQMMTMMSFICSCRNKKIGAELHIMMMMSFI
jgi:hypothetical protein